MELNSKIGRKLSAFLHLSKDELECLAALQGRPRLYRKGQQLTEEGQTGHHAYVLHEGWACSYKDLSNGSRQIISFPLAGDVVGLRSMLLRTADHSFAMLTDATVSLVKTEQVLGCLHEYPRLGAALLWSASRDEAMVVEHLINIGRRSAEERVAHLILEFAERLHLVGEANDLRYSCPLSQPVLADALGLTAIHINRIFRQLRDQGLMTVRDGIVEIHDINGMQKLSGFRSGYLDDLVRPAPD